VVAVVVLVQQVIVHQAAQQPMVVQEKPATLQVKQ
jgi:hypothetical protein